MEHLLGKSIKGYELRELIGSGGFGAVFRAYQPVVGREVAIKVILPEHANTPMFIRRFETEAQLVARLEHPYIVPLYDYWRDADGAYLVMRYLRGGSLSRIIRRGGSLTLEQTNRMLNQIASALAVAHNSGIVHRDLKPDNILLDVDDVSRGNFYLSDFGIAKDIGSKDSSLTQTGTIIGSPAYLSPEQITGEPITPLSDVYTLGILLHYALTGEHPFPGKTPTAMLVHQMQDPMPLLQMRREDIPDLLEEVLQRATDKNPAQRYASVTELALEFNRAMRPPGTSTTSTRRVSSEEANALLIGRDTADVPNPYKGLAAFEEADSSEFFGREALTERLLTRLKPHSDLNEGDHLLVIVGPSGSGKSSVVKAGLIPALRRGALPNSENWFYVEMVPGAHPIEELEAALLRVAVNPPESMLRQLQEDERGLTRAIKRVLPDDNSQLVLFIDQFEEVFTLTDRESERVHFLNSLMTAVTEPRNRLRLILTLRADFYDRPLSYHSFGDLVRNYTEVVLPLSPQELESAIVQPARKMNISLEAGLSAAIVADVKDQPGALPLMQYALTQLFDRRNGALMTLNAYNEIGRAMGALARRAEELHESLKPSAQSAARQLFLRLVTLGEGTEDTRRRVLRSELNALGSDEDMQYVLDVFGKQRLLTFDNDPITREPTIEVAHEALIREWRRLRDWLDSAREDLRTHRRLYTATQEWVAAKRDRSFLATGARLDQFEALQASQSIAINTDEREYLHESLQQRQERERAEQERIQREEALEQASRQRLWALLVVASIAAVIATGLALLAFNSQRQAVEARAAAESAALLAQDNEKAAEAVALGAYALNLINDNNPTQALKLALEAVQRRGDIISVQQAFGTAAYAPAPIAQLNPLEDASLLSVSFNGDGSRVVAGASNGHLLIIDPQSNAVLHDILAHTAENDDGETVGVPIYAAAYNPRAAQVASADGRGRIFLWDAASGEQTLSLEGHTGAVNALMFSPDGRYLLSGGDDTEMYLWDVASGEKQVTYEGIVGRVLSIDYSANGNYVTSSTADDPETGVFDRAVRVFEAQSGELVQALFVEENGWVRAVSIDPNGEWVAAASYDPNEFGGTIRVWEVQSGELLRSLYGHTDVITTLDFSPDGNTLLSGSWDKTVRRYDIHTGVEVQRFDTHSDRLLDVTFSPDGTLALTSSGRDVGIASDNSALLTTLISSAPIHVMNGHEDWVWAVAYNADGSQIATGSGHLNRAEGDNSIRLWEATNGEQLARLDGHTDTVAGLAYHPDGAQLASASWDRTIMLWDINTGERIATLEGHTNQVNDVDFSPDGSTLLSGGRDGALRLWNVATQESIRVIENAHYSTNAEGVVTPARVFRAKFSPNGELIASSGSDSMVRLWNARTGELIREFRGHSGWVSTVMFSHDGTLLVSGADNDLIVWDIDAPEGEEEYRRLIGHEGFVYGGDFSPDDRYIISGASDTTVRLWDVQGGYELRRFEGHSNWVLDVEFSPQGESAISVAEDNTARVWRIAPNTDELIEWVRANRYVPEITCEEREQYNVKPLCEGFGISDTDERAGRQNSAPND